MEFTRRGIARLAGTLVVAVVGTVVVSGSAWAGSTRSGAGAYCAKHPHAKRCQASGSGGPSPQMTVTVSPNPVVEIGPSEIHVIVQVETLPQYAGDEVTLSSSQLLSSCKPYPNPVQFVTDAGLSGPGFHGSTITIVLDNDGNATVALYADECAPGQDLVEADLDVAPYLTAVTDLDIQPPTVTTAGLVGYPNNEVETGDSVNIPQSSGDSNVYTVFYVETDPVYAERTARINSLQLEARCDQGYWFQGANGGSVVSAPTGTPNPNGPVSLLDDDGNAVFIFFGASCAAGDSVVSAEVEAGTHPTYTFDYTILPPAPTI
jgi:hypothetical protein